MNKQDKKKNDWAAAPVTKKRDVCAYGPSHTKLLRDGQPNEPTNEGMTNDDRSCKKRRGGGREGREGQSQPIRQAKQNERTSERANEREIVCS